MYLSCSQLTHVCAGQKPPELNWDDLSEIKVQSNTFSISKLTLSLVGQRCEYETQELVIAATSKLYLVKG